MKKYIILFFTAINKNCILNAFLKIEFFLLNVKNHTLNKLSSYINLKAEWFVDNDSIELGHANTPAISYSDNHA